MPLQTSGTSVLSKSLEKQESSVDVDLNININNLHSEDTKRYVDNLKKLCKYNSLSSSHLKFFIGT